VFGSGIMPEKKRKKAGVAIIIAFVIGLILGYVTNEMINTKDRTYFKSGLSIIYNSGFEEGADSPEYWVKAWIPVDNLTMTIDDEIVYNGNKSVSINNTHIYDEVVSNNWYQTAGVVPKNQRIELSGWIKTIDAESVVMVIRCEDKDNELVGFATTQTKSEINGTTDWGKHTTSLIVPSDTEQIRVLLALTGTGQVWFDDVTLVVK
jgi:hypothetical protein